MSYQPTHWRANRTVSHPLGTYRHSSVDYEKKISIRVHDEGFEVKPFGKAPFKLGKYEIERLLELSPEQRRCIKKQVEKDNMIEKL